MGLRFIFIFLIVRLFGIANSFLKSHHLCSFGYDYITD